MAKNGHFCDNVVETELNVVNVDVSTQQQRQDFVQIHKQN